MSKYIKYIPNILTIIRFVLIPYIVYLIFQEQYIMALVVLVVSGITDLLDGFIARRFECITDFGKLVDPLADKATQVAILLVLVVIRCYSFMDYCYYIIKRNYAHCTVLLSFTVRM